MRQCRLAVLAAVLGATVLGATAAAAADAPDPQRGRLLYENHCQGCHESTVHVREAHEARSLADLRFQITRWQHYEDLGWTYDEMRDVLAYLNRSFYQLPR